MFDPNRTDRQALLDIDSVADYLGTSARHVRRLVADRRIPHHKVGGLVRFKLDRIDDWLELHERRPRDAALPAPQSSSPIRSSPRRRSAQTAPPPPLSGQLRLDE